MQTSHAAAADLYWIPLGAGGHSVRFNGRVFEAIQAACQHRRRRDLYHAALTVDLDGHRYIELAPSPDGDLAEAIGGPCRLTTDPQIARRLLAIVATAPTPVWGRDELRAGEMWNSNSLIAWLVAGAGLPAHLLTPPGRGRAPGWDAGLEVARRSGAHEPPDGRRGRLEVAHV